MKPSYEDLLKQLKSARSAVRVWETTMMQACGKDDPASVAAKLAVPATKNLLPKSGLRFFSYDADSGLDDHATADEAIEAANASIAYYRGKSCDEGVDIVGSVCWGVIMQESAMTNLRTETDDSGRSREICDYVLLPSVETPITDSFLAPDYAELQRKYEALAAESAALKKFCKSACFDADYEAELGMERGGFTDDLNDIKTPTTDAALAEIRAQGRAEGINFAASRLAAAFNNGFVDKPLEEVFDVVRMILSAKEEINKSPDPDGLSGEYVESALNQWEQQLRKEAGL